MLKFKIIIYDSNKNVIDTFEIESESELMARLTASTHCNSDQTYDVIQL